MLVYLFVLTVLFMIALIKTKPDKILPDESRATAKTPPFFVFLLLSFIYFIMILKQPAVGDYRQYALHFLSSVYRPMDKFLNIMEEPAFYVLTKFMTNYTLSTFWYFAVTSAVICISVGIFINRYSDNKKYAIYFYYTIGLFAFTMAGLRQSLAMSVCLFAHEAIRKRKPLRFLLLVCLAFLFHKSAVFFLPAYLLAKIRWKTMNVLGIVAVYGFISITFNSLYQYIADWLDYSYGIEGTGNGGIFLAILLIISALAIIYKNKLLLKNPDNLIFINLHFGVLALWLFRMFTRTVERPAFYYLYSTIILLDKILDLQADNETEATNQKILVISSLFLFALFFLYRTARDRNLIPYIFI
ncbi:hypothetical protein acsn021_22580 [Anaerocolumna cellulosilytica]|uniref:Uncharacterized protein n=1 Tax=Anaerocolumna cellulosilytica TaxID=433286 RepID=A0A6S6R065_9FIRM|nr:EpsG family protein [Anaerocolumna cellulosilytica]MBB5194095.1 hypothetical protein [Anaerocolumna cellulosilytica]BCJ94689.1 hypothetical protein acsn021_22580 [Anaerocolumna cellulosilytica]